MLKPVLAIEQTITAPFEHLEFIVEPFDKATIGTGNKEGGDLLSARLQGSQERVKAMQTALAHPLDPSPQTPLGPGLGQWAIKDSRQLTLEIIGQLEGRRVAKEAFEHLMILWGQISRGFA